MTDEVTDLDLLRTRVLLEALQGEQERLHAALGESGVQGFADQADWLMDHWSPDRKLAWRRKWERLGLKPSEIAPQREHLTKPESIANPKPRRIHRATVFTDRQLQIALGVLERKDTAA